MFKRLKLVIEVKIAKDLIRMKSLIDEINADILAYKTAYERVVFVIYDLGTIRDEAEFKSSIEAVEGVAVVIIKD